MKPGEAVIRTEPEISLPVAHRILYFARGKPICPSEVHDCAALRIEAIDSEARSGVDPAEVVLGNRLDLIARNPICRGELPHR